MYEHEVIKKRVWRVRHTTGLMIARGHRGQSLGRSAEEVQSENTALVADNVLGSLFSDLMNYMSYSMLTPYHAHPPASEGWPSLSPYLLVLCPTIFFNINSNHLPSVR
jgi:hypothetical protein